jgi:hypothetical protein
MDGTFLCRCPPMEVFRTPDPKVRMTDKLYADVTITVRYQQPASDARLKGYLCWQATPVRSKDGFITSRVDKTSAFGFLFDVYGEKYNISLAVSAEQDIGPVALPTPATGSVQTPWGLLLIRAELPRVVSVPIGGGTMLVRDADVVGTVQG